ncbi:MAG: hypothetical protein KKH52_03230, partial [Nanoarchaeota archaeon]|nr:hypothetical protein [Nanoarchaeota archaeon]
LKYKNILSIIGILPFADAIINILIMPLAYFTVGVNDFSNIIKMSSFMSWRMMILMSFIEVALLSIMIYLYLPFIKSIKGLFKSKKRVINR